MKQEFIKKWKSWWMLQKQGAELTDAFERELNAIIEQEVASKNLVKADVKHELIAYQIWCYKHPEYDQVTETPRVEIYLKAINCA